MDPVDYELEKAFYRVGGTLPSAQPSWQDVWPTETAGDGRLRPNNKKTGAAQGRASRLRKAPCRQCGFLNDLAAVDHSGGSIDGNGAITGHTLQTTQANTSGAPGPDGKVIVHTEKSGNPVASVNAGCALCGSKNSTRLRGEVEAMTDLSSRLTMPFGF